MSLRAMFSSISGLQADSQWLDVIGNNISNVNTVAYKASRVEFSDLFSQSVFGGTADNPSAGLGGLDPLQVGLGTRMASVFTLFNQGAIQVTGNSTDVAIQGDGFLVAQSGGQTYYTRAGNLTFDSQGNLVDANGGLIQGFNANIQYTQKVIDTTSNVPGQPAVVTTASFVVNNADLAGLSNIQIPRDTVLPPKATTKINFKGNLDSFQQADQTGGILQINTPTGPVLPVATDINFFGFFALNPTKVTLDFFGNPPGPGSPYAIQQLSNFSANNQPILQGGFPLSLVQGAAGNYAWDNQPPTPPAQQIVETVFDSLGTPRQVTVQFYQVNDLGEAGVNNPAGPNQVLYAWYAFETTGGQQPSTQNLLGGTGILEGNKVPFPLNPSYDRGQGNAYYGDFVWFNTDGSLAGQGGTVSLGGPFTFNTQMDVPRIYLPPNNTTLPASPIPTVGSEITPIDLNFGTAGILGQGFRDGIYSDAEGSYQVVNGVNSYQPKSTAFAASQDGYSDGILQSLSFDKTGTILGLFSNGQKTALGQVALAVMANSDGLQKAGNNRYTPSPNTGPVQVGLAGQAGFGAVQGGSLELSNVDLPLELTNMIVAQRGFDTNSRMIATVNQTMDTVDRLGQGG